MNKYSIDVKVTGYINIHVNATSRSDALEKAQNIFESEYMQSPIRDMAYKSTESIVVNDSEEGNEI